MESKIVYLSTLTEKGYPWPNPVWWIQSSDNTMTVFSKPDSKKVENIRRAYGKCSVLIPGDDNGHGFQVWRGRAHLIDNVDPMDSWLFVQKYTDDINKLHEQGFGPPIKEYSKTYSMMIWIRRVGDVFTIPG